MEVFWFIILSLVGGFAGLLVFLYFLWKGQFVDAEDSKYQLFWDEEDNAKKTK